MQIAEDGKEKLSKVLDGNIQASVRRSVCFGVRLGLELALVQSGKNHIKITSSLTLHFND